MSSVLFGLSIYEGSVGLFDSFRRNVTSSVNVINVNVRSELLEVILELITSRVLRRIRDPSSVEFTTISGEDVSHFLRVH